MGSLKVTLMMVFLLFGGAACGDADRDKGVSGETVNPSELIRGHYTFGHEVRALRPCGAEADLWVIDGSGQLRGLFGQLTGSVQGDLRIFVMATGTSGPPPADGFGADYVGAVKIGEVIYAALEGFGCDLDLAGFLFRASGNEPFWMVEVLPESMRLARPGHPDFTWSEFTMESQGEAIVLQGKGGDFSGTLTIEPGPAFDSMSGAFFSHRAHFDLDGVTFLGTALRGTAAEAE
jgi:uncharacterized membrane protein